MTAAAHTAASPRVQQRVIAVILLNALCIGIGTDAASRAAHAEPFHALPLGSGS